MPRILIYSRYFAEQPFEIELQTSALVAFSRVLRDKLEVEAAEDEKLWRDVSDRSTLVALEALCDELLNKSPAFLKTPSYREALKKDGQLTLEDVSDLVDQWESVYAPAMTAAMERAGLKRGAERARAITAMMHVADMLDMEWMLHLLSMALQLAIEGAKSGAELAALLGTADDLSADERRQLALETLFLNDE